jgi:DNA polymerase-3 subunit chi
MSKKNVLFLELATANKNSFVCDVAEKLYGDGKSITIFCKEINTATLLDRLLWSWKQDSFIPHSVINEPQDFIEESVILTTNLNFKPQTDALILFNPAPEDYFSQYSFIIDFAEVYDNQKRLESRERYKKLRDNETYHLQFLKPGVFLNSALLRT